MKVKALVGILALAGLAAPGIASATNGYFSHGFGVKSSGMAGVGIALPQDAMAAATNPAGMVMVGDRIDFGLTWFRPQRESSITGNGYPGVNGTYDGNGEENFFIPEFGYNKMINSNMSLGVAVYGNGGMNTHYDKSPFTGFGGNSPAGVDLMQLFVSPTLSMKVNPDNAIGVALNLAYQRFSADGLNIFDNSVYSSSPGNVTNKGHDSSTGWGVRVGWIGQITPSVTLGATYQSKTKMSKFNDYKGLFAGQGSFDIPENYGIGIAVKTTPALTLAADVQQINYSGVDAIANPLSNLTVKGQQLGSTNGPGFGWRDVTVFKIGASYVYSPSLTLRAGVSHARQPIPNDQTFFNILAPGIVEDHLTLGATWTLANKSELSVSYMHAFQKDVNGSNSIPSGFGGGNANLKMYQDAVGIAYGWKM